METNNLHPEDRDGRTERGSCGRTRAGRNAAWYDSPEHQCAPSPLLEVIVIVIVLLQPMIETSTLLASHRTSHAAPPQRAAVGFVAGWEKGEKVWGFEMTS